MSATQGSAAFNSTGYAQVSSRPIYDQASGPSWEVVYDGLQSYIATLASSLQSAGARTVITNRDNGTAQLVAVYVRDPSQPTASETPQDRWSIVWEEQRDSIFLHPAIIAESNGYISAAQYRTDIQDAASSGETNPVSTTTFPLSQVVWQMLSMGQETVSKFIPLLRRHRSYSLTYPGTPYRIDVRGQVYTRASLVSTFGIVDPLLSRIPLDPETTLPTGFVFGWFVAQQEFEYVRERGAMKAEEVLGFRWGVWNAAPDGSGNALYPLL